MQSSEKMKKQELLDIYSDYLISAFGQTTGTGLAGLLGNSVSHDQVQQLLAQDRLGSAELGQMVKPYVRQIQEGDGVMILDDSIAKSPTRTRMTSFAGTMTIAEIGA